MSERNQLFEPLLRVGRGAPSTEEEDNGLNLLRVSSPDMFASTSRFFAEAAFTQCAAIESVRKNLKGLVKRNKKLTARKY